MDTSNNKLPYSSKRFYKRVPLSIYAKAKSNSYLLPFNFTDNVSLGGMFITTGKRVPSEFQISRGSQVRLQFMLPNSPELSDVDCEVVWSDTCIDLNNNYLTYGLGLRFTRMSKRT
jgi:Tfp pilus assembly protein PilZ